MGDRKRWTILAIGTFSQAATCSFLYGIPMLVPALRRDDGLSLLGASALISAPMVGLLLTLIAWGALADRRGERLVITTDCGFGREGLSRRIAYYKCVSLVEGTNIVRRELGLPEARVRAADPSLYFASVDETANATRGAPQ